jgi:LAS superfamily LD-carboxypeptidase LdcB
MLVNQDNVLSASFVPQGIVTYQDVQMRDVARDAFIEMKAAMAHDDIHGVRIVSGYRSYEYQKNLYDNCNRAKKSVQPPGASEHQTGLALDISLDGALSQGFADTCAGRWLSRFCHEFGFIIRYPAGKTGVTDIIYEPWHLRYVGAPHSTIMHTHGWTLEEYHHHHTTYIKL